MGKVKDIQLRPIDRRTANEFVRRVHYSGKVVNNSQIHIGVFLDDTLEGVLQFGPSLDKRKVQGLVDGTLWNEFIELNRLAFTDVLPRNSESRAIAIAMRLLRKYAPQLKWVISFADGTQCGDGTIYRASGFVLTGISSRDEMLRLPGGEVVHRIACNTNDRMVMGHGGAMLGAARLAAQLGAERLHGFQLRYIYFLDPSYRERLTVPVLPYSEIERRGARMYRGKRLSCATGETDNAPQSNEETGGASPTVALSSDGAA